MHAGQLVDFVIEPTLRYLDPDIPLTRAAMQLVLGTALHESANLQYIDQLSRLPTTPGPAYGLWQMEARTMGDHFDWLHAKSADGTRVRAALSAKIEAMIAPWRTLPHQVHGNLYLACALCRVHYRRVSEALPAADDAPALASYWKRYYNTSEGAGTIAQGVVAMQSAARLV